MSASTIMDTIAPQFATDPNKASTISLARIQTNRCFYGTKTEYAVALRAAHMLTINKISENEHVQGGGEIASKREGDLSVSFHKSSDNGKSQDDLSLSKYGRQLKGLRAGSGPFMGVISQECDNGCSS